MPVETLEVIWRLLGMVVTLPIGCLLIYYDDRPVSRTLRRLCTVGGALFIGIALALGFFPMYHVSVHHCRR
jgi:hypothetical protein